MDGTVLFGSETRGKGAEGQRSKRAGNENPYSEEDEEQVMERLRELGYVA
jgi:hypothetical protein